MPTPTIPDGELFFNATTYTGNGGTQTIVNGAPGQSFQPDFVWIKNRGAAGSHVLFNVITGGDKQLFSNLTNAEQTNANITNGFTSNGFTVGNNTTGTGSTNQTANAYVAWNWKAGGAAVSNTSGSITSQVSVNTTSGFSIVTYTGNGSAGATVGHGLGTAPKMMIFKARNTTSSWLVWHTGYNSNQAQMLLDSTAAIYNPGNGLYFNSTYPSSSVATLGTSGSVNGSGTTYVAYMWSEIAGYSAFGSYTGNGSTDGPFVYTGFRPKFVMVKASSFSTASTVWNIWDTSRSLSNAALKELYPNSADAEGTDSDGCDILSNGFKPKRSSDYANSNGQTYIYMAFAENPFKYSSAR